MAKAKIMGVWMDNGTYTVRYATGTEKVYAADKLPKTVSAWLTENKKADPELVREFVEDAFPELFQPVEEWTKPEPVKASEEPQEPQESEEQEDGNQNQEQKEQHEEPNQEPEPIEASEEPQVDGWNMESEPLPQIERPTFSKPVDLTLDIIALMAAAGYWLVMASARRIKAAVPVILDIVLYIGAIVAYQSVSLTRDLPGIIARIASAIRDKAVMVGAYVISRMGKAYIATVKTAAILVYMLCM